MKTVLITGAAKGIGAAIAEELANEGYQVIINYRTSEQKAQELKTKLTNKIKSGLAISDNDLKDFRCLFDECILKEEYYIIINE